MKRLFWYVLIFSSFFWILSVSAASITSWPRQVEATPTTLKVEWDKIDGALGYYLYYWKTSGVGTSYDTQYPELIESTGVTLSNLDAGKTYYVAFSAVDGQGQEWKYSPETIMKTSVAWSESSALKLSLKTVRVTSANTLDLTFSNAIDTSAQRDFKLVKSGTTTEAQIVGSQVAWNVVTLTLWTPLETNQKYDLTVISLQDTNKKSIESGVDGIATFTTPIDLSNVDTWNLNSWGPQVMATVDTWTQTSTWTLQDHSWNIGQNISVEQIQKNTEMAAQNNTNLPKTGPETLLIVFFSLLLWLGAFYYKRKLS